MKFLIVTFVVFSLFLQTSFAQEIPLFTSQFITEDSVKIPTRDGGFISATIARKAGNKKPVAAILFFTTYYFGNGDLNVPKRAADRDYVGVIAYSRGIRSDLKNYIPFEHEANDVYDVIDWISKQSWNNGKVGMYGGSYTGFVQWAATKKLHPALKTIIPQAALMPGFDFPMENNIPVASIFNWSHDNIFNYKRLPANFFPTWYQSGVSYRSLDSLANQPNPIFQKWLTHPDYDDYWRSLIPSKEEFARINIPILITTGYYDGSQISALQYAKQYWRYNTNPKLYLVIGPYDHMGAQRNARNNLMGYDLDSVANVDMRELAFQWLDHILRGGKKPELLKDRINYQVMGTNQWKHAASFQKMNNDTLKYYLLDLPKMGHYSMSFIPTKRSDFVTQIVDFNNRSQQAQNNYFTPNIILDTLSASNGMIYFTDPFQTPVTINGAFTGELNVSINKKDMDVSIAFYEITPEGKYFYLTRYLGRASYAKDPSRRQLLQPGKIETIPLENTRMVGKKLSEGSRLLVIVNVNRHPYEIINYGTGKDVNDETIKDAGEPLQVKWYNNSYIKIPVIK